MTAVKNFFRRCWDSLSDPRLTRALLIVLPCLILILVSLLLLPALLPAPGRAASLVPAESPAVREQSAAEPVEIPASAPAAVPSPSPSPSPSPEPEPTSGIPLRLRADSVNRDLYIRILDDGGAPVTGRIFRLDVRFPDGNTYSYDSEEDGSSCYLVRLEPGEYLVSLRPEEGYTAPEPLLCTVQAEAHYAAIENIESVTEILDVSQMPQDEIPEETGDAPEETVPEIIILSDDGPLPEEQPAPEDAGRERCQYRFALGPNGYLLYRGSSVESDVFPVDEDGDGVPEYGLRLEDPGSSVIIETEEGEGESAEPVPEPYYVSVLLYQADGRPVEDFEATEIPLTETAEKRVGWQSIDGKEYFFYEDESCAVGLKQIGGKLYYFDQHGVKASSVGIDVSSYNDEIDWEIVKSQGIDFAIVRVGGRGWTSGRLYGDYRTAEYLRGARSAGIKLGVYFYSTAVNPYEAVEEASLAVKTVGGIPLDYPIFIDMEYSGEYPEGRADRLSPSERAEIAIAFCETVRNSGYRPGVYGGQNYLKSAIDYFAVSRYTIWLASYTAGNRLPDFDQRYDIWQFTDRAKVSGVPGDVDVNVILNG